jgi:hypothetical protein
VTVEFCEVVIWDGPTDPEAIRGAFRQVDALQDDGWMVCEIRWDEQKVVWHFSRLRRLTDG